MKLNIKGNDVTPDKVAAALAACEREYGLKIKGATIYVRFERDDGSGQTVEPLYNGEEISREFVFRKPKQPVRNSAQQLQSLVPMAPESSEPPLSARGIIEICQQCARRMLSGAEMQQLIELEKSRLVRRTDLDRALNIMTHRCGRFNVKELLDVLRSF